MIRDPGLLSSSGYRQRKIQSALYESVINWGQDISKPWKRERIVHPLDRKNEGEETGNVFNLLKSPTHLPGMRQGNYCGRIRWLLGHDKAPPRRRHRNVSSRFQRDYSLAVPGMGCVADSATLQEKRQRRRRNVLSTIFSLGQQHDEKKTILRLLL